MRSERSTPHRHVKKTYYADMPLACPNCGHGYTHIEAVYAFARQEDDRGLRSVITFSDDGTPPSTRTDATTGKNPSPRRGAVVLVMSCEHKCPDFVIGYVQHKGTTYTTRVVEDDELPGAFEIPTVFELESDMDDDR